MGQKTNSNIFRLGYKNNEWNSKYIEKNLEEFSIYVYQDFEIKKYIDRFFKRYKILIHSCIIRRTDKSLEIFISYYITLRSIFLINKINQDQNIIIKKKKKFLYNVEKDNYKRKRLWSIKKFKEKKKNSFLFNFNNFSEKLLESLNVFTNNKLNINIILQNINKGLSLRIKNKYAEFFKKTLLDLRKYLKTTFFRECINILTIVILKKKTSKILSEFISFQFSVIKRHNFFLNFLKRVFILILKSKFSYIKGIKLMVKGRLNGKLRSSIHIIQMGKISLQTFDKNIDYNQSVSFTPYGTVGVKIWICEK